MATEHRDIPDAERHEVKGASTATSGHVLKADGDGTSSFVAPSTLNNITIGSSLEAKSITAQNPAGTDTPLQVLWGDATSNTDVDVDVNGAVTILTSGLYFVTFNLNIGRSNSSGTAIIVARMLLNDVEVGIVQANRLDITTSLRTFNASILRAFTQSDVIKVQIIRDSAGTNDGGLVPVDPVLAGWGDSPSAAIRVQRITGGY